MGKNRGRDKNKGKDELPDKPKSFTEAMEEDEVDSHPHSADRSGRFPLDALIRKYGWQIWRRKGNEEPIWLKGNLEVKQSEVLLRIPQNELADAEYQEFLQVKEGME